MNEESVLELVYRLSRLPVRVYTEGWELRSSFGTGKHTETAYDGQMFQEVHKIGRAHV